MAYSGTSYPYTSGSRGSTSQIYDIFRGHGNSLFNRKWEAIRAIDDWSNNLMKEITEHALKQKDLVEQAYKIHDKHLDNMRDQLVDICRVYERENDTEQIKQLVEKCKSVQVEIVNLKFTSINKEFIEITTVEPSDQMNQEDPKPGKIRNTESEKRSMRRNETGSVHNRDSNSDLYPKPTTSTSDRGNQSSTTQPAYDRDRSRNTNDNKTSMGDLNTDNNAIEKCPMCFMIFPSTMSTMGREMHVDDHCKDE